jgi:hypothetical protein
MSSNRKVLERTTSPVQPLDQDKFSMSKKTKQYFKYRPLYQIGEKGQKEVHPFTKALFSDASLWYASPSEFNDPFDCNLRIHVSDSTDKEWMHYLNEQIREHPLSEFPVEHKSLKIAKKNKQWKIDRSYCENVGDPTLKLNRERSSVLCLSSKGNSIPMFSYYADSHRGIAVEFSFGDENVPCGVDYSAFDAKGIVFGKVKYHDSFPDLNFHRLAGTVDLTKNIIFAKHFEWKHEDEYRIFRRGHMPSSVKFDKSLMTRVVFGCKTTPDDISLVKNWLSGWPTEVVISKAIESTNNFDLKIVDLERVKGTGIV